MKKNLKIYLVLEYLLFIIFAIYLVSTKQQNTIPVINILFFTIILFVSRNITIFHNSMTHIATSIVLPILFPAMVILDPFWVAIITFIGTIELKYRDKKFIWYQFLFNRTMFFISAGTASLIFKISQYYFEHLIISFLLASIAYFLVNNILVYIVVRIANGKQDTSFSYFLELTKNLFLSFVLGLILYYSHIYLGKIFFIIAIILIYLVKDFIYTNLKELNSVTQIIESFLKVIDSKDQYTEGHCERVARYTRVLCEELGINKTKTERFVNIAKIHDIGKISIPDKILKSSSQLSRQEYNEIKRHSYYGYQLLKDIDLLNKDLDIILCHHEHYNGAGYPDGKKGEDIPLGSRILSICDAFDVMTYGRSYKPAMNKEEVVQELKVCSATQFDPNITKTMIKLVINDRFKTSFSKRSRRTTSFNKEKTQIKVNI